MLGTGYAFSIAAGIAVALRILGNNMRGRFGFRSDDLWIAVGYVFWLIEEILGLYGLHVGLKATSMKDPRMMTFHKFTYISAVFYYPAGACARIGIVLFYRRIFCTPVTPHFQHISSAIMVFLGLYGIATTLTESMACLPGVSDWDHSVPGRCINYTNFFIAAASLECVFDVIIICLPLFEVLKLQLSWKRKVGVLLIFLLGSFSVVTGIIRVVLTVTTVEGGRVNPTIDILWLHIHNGTLFLCACLPTYRPIAKAASNRIACLWTKIAIGTRSKFVTGSRSRLGTFPKNTKAETSSNMNSAEWIEGHLELGNVGGISLSNHSGTSNTSKEALSPIL
jgi:hypothetical protein